MTSHCSSFATINWSLWTGVKQFGFRFSSVISDRFLIVSVEKIRRVQGVVACIHPCYYSNTNSPNKAGCVYECVWGMLEPRDSCVCLLGSSSPCASLTVEINSELTLSNILMCLWSHFSENSWSFFCSFVCVWVRERIVEIVRLDQ